MFIGSLSDMYLYMIFSKILVSYLWVLKEPGFCLNSDPLIFYFLIDISFTVFPIGHYLYLKHMYSFLGIGRKFPC